MMPSSSISGLQLSRSDFLSSARGIAPASIALAINDPTLLGGWGGVRKLVYAALAAYIGLLSLILIYFSQPINCLLQQIIINIIIILSSKEVTTSFPITQSKVKVKLKESMYLIYDFQFHCHISAPGVRIESSETVFFTCVRLRAHDKMKMAQHWR